MLSKWGKFYKCSFALLFSLVLSFVFIGKSVQAATGTSFSFTEGNGTYSFYVDGWEAAPTNIEMADQGTSPATNNSWYTFEGSSNVYIRFDSTAGSSAEYKGGYINGCITVTVKYPISVTPTGSSNMKRNYTFNGVQTETVSCSMISSSGESAQYVVTLCNYSLNPDGGSVREIYLGNLIIDYQFTRTADGTLTYTSCTPSITTKNGGFKCNPLASAGVSIAGQLYSAIENSTSVSDIVSYLSAIEDASGDINIAVAHINEYLIPQVIQHLISIATNTANIKINTDELVRLLTAFYNTWPSYSAQVLFYLDQLVNMNAEQSSIADEVQQEYASKAAQSASEAAGMQAVLPQVDQSDFDIGSQLDSGTVTTLSAFWAMFPNNALIGTMFAIAIAGIAAGYFLYGKKS